MKNLFIVIAFCILVPTLLYSTVRPIGGENGDFWEQNSVRTIQWDTSDFHGYVNIYLWQRSSATFILVDTSISASYGEYSWLIPTNFDAGEDFRIKVQQIDSTNYYQFSETFFPIYPESSPIQAGVKESKPENMNLKVFPNPANSTFRLKFEASNESNVQLGIYDCLGNEVLILNEKCVLGTNEKTIDCSRLSIGYYLVKVRCGASVQTQSFVVWR